MNHELSIKKIQECNRVLEKAESNVVWDILRQCDKFIEWDHYPPDDVYDKDSHAQYYYHAHPQEDNLTWQEHGHFHLFLRCEGIPESCKPLVMQKNHLQPDANDFCHLVAISMDTEGRPIRLFTTNRWATGETWYAADDVCTMLDSFSIDHAVPSWPTNIWLTEIVKLYQEEIIELIHQRDECIAAWQSQNPGKNPFEEQSLEILSVLDITH